VSLSEQVDTSTPTGKMVFTVLGAVAELERSLIVERVKAGLRNARAKGKRLGRPPKVLDAGIVSALRRQWNAVGGRFSCLPSPPYFPLRGSGERFAVAPPSSFVFRNQVSRNCSKLVGTNDGPTRKQLKPHRCGCFEYQEPSLEVRVHDLRDFFREVVRGPQIAAHEADLAGDILREFWFAGLVSKKAMHFDRSGTGDGGHLALFLTALLEAVRFAVEDDEVGDGGGSSVTVAIDVLKLVGLLNLLDQVFIKCQLKFDGELHFVGLNHQNLNRGRLNLGRLFFCRSRAAE